MAENQHAIGKCIPVFKPTKKSMQHIILNLVCNDILHALIWLNWFQIIPITIVLGSICPSLSFCFRLYASTHDYLSSTHPLPNIPSSSDNMHFLSECPPRLQPSLAYLYSKNWKALRTHPASALPILHFNYIVMLALWKFVFTKQKHLSKCTCLKKSVVITVYPT